ncbi:Xaa-Pro aminopeptidase [Desulfitispora alkaliphila]|uniref:M24 family metallopeptidase n=1 Tax=Desulfitispora alkaliphila TaxID=622674 RepID=UPI003D1B01F9
MQNQRIKELKAYMEKSEIECVIIAKPENVYYYSGFTGSAGALIIATDRQELITDFRYVAQAGEQSPHFKVEKTTKGVLKEIGELIDKERYNVVALEKKHLSYDAVKELTETFSTEVQLESIDEKIMEFRSIKDAREQELLKQSAALTDEAFTHILNFAKEGMQEADIALELEFFMRKRGATGPSFPYIVASGPRSALPHGVATNKKINSGEVITLDFGCMYKRHASDMTRNIVVGTPTERHKEIYHIVLEAQEAALNSIKPGMKASGLDQVARRIITDAGYGEYFGHGLGHGIGLNVHENPSVSPRSEGVLKPGMVISVEPGIYLPNLGGIRIEDVVLIEEDGYENLTKSSKELISLG